MRRSAINSYFEQKVLNASPVELTNMLYQRAISCVKQAREHLAARRIAERAQAINGAYAVIAELNGALRLDVAPELAGRLRSLYIYMQGRLLEGNFRQSDAALAEVLGLLNTLADAWSGVMAQVEGVSELALTA